MYEKKTIAARLFTQHHEIVHRAASASHRSVDAYVRDVIVAWAASDLKMAPPDMTLYRHTDVVAEAARIAGVTPREFTAAAAREAAMTLVTRPSEIRELRPPARAGAPSRRRTGSGKP